MAGAIRQPGAGPAGAISPAAAIVGLMLVLMTPEARTLARGLDRACGKIHASRDSGTRRPHYALSLFHPAAKTCPIRPPSVNYLFIKPLRQFHGMRV